ncbi:MAG: hypothetical protein IPP77_15560 [Bacteroidetes bacterium]|nr:hypothetical protein [Bacteroidota bacterium]
MNLKLRLTGMKGRKTTANIGLPKAGLTCIIERLCFYFAFVQADSLVLLMPAFGNPKNVTTNA